MNKIKKHPSFITLERIKHEKHYLEYELNTKNTNELNNNNNNIINNNKNENKNNNEINKTKIFLNSNILSIGQNNLLLSKLPDATMRSKNSFIKSKKILLLYSLFDLILFFILWLSIVNFKNFQTKQINEFHYRSGLLEFFFLKAGSFILTLTGLIDKKKNFAAWAIGFHLFMLLYGMVKFVVLEWNELNNLLIFIIIYYFNIIIIILLSIWRYFAESRYDKLYDALKENEKYEKLLANDLNNNNIKKPNLSKIRYFIIPPKQYNKNNKKKKLNQYKKNENTLLYKFNNFMLSLYTLIPYLDLLKLLKPYFWPNDTINSSAFWNRVRALSTWLCVIISKITGLLSPLFLAAAVNNITNQKYSDAELNVLFYALFTLISKAFTELQRTLYLHVKRVAYTEVAEITFRHIHNLSLRWHLSKKLGNVIRSIDRGADAANNLVTYLFLWLIPTIAECIAVCIVFLLRFDSWELSLLAILIISLYCYLTIKLTLWRKKFREKTNKTDNLLHDIAVDSLINYETVKYFTAENFETKRYVEAVAEYQKYYTSTQYSLSILNMSQHIVLQVTLFISLVMSISLVKNDDMDVGDFVAVNAYIYQLFMPLFYLGTIYHQIVRSVIDLQHLRDLLNEEPDVIDIPNAPLLKPQKIKNIITNNNKKNDNIMTNLEINSWRDVGMKVKFDNVSFLYYGTDGRGVRNLNFEILPGQTLAFVGQTGAGKTTISRLIFRFFDPTYGQVLLDDKDISLYDQRSVRQLIGIVPQDTVLFNDTILYNILYGNPNATMEQVEKVAEAAQIKDFILSLPEGWKTVVGERGLKLSGGEKQRVSIARCLLKNPPIVILDEATSALDSKTEQSVQNALIELGKNRTTIIIAHRLSTIRHADNIIVLKEGEIIEKGNHNQLMKINGEYANMVYIQAEEERRKQEEKDEENEETKN